MVDPAKARVLMDMYTYCATKTAELSLETLRAIRAAHPECRTMEARIDQAATAADLATLKHQCRLYCTAWNHWIQAAIQGIVS